MGLPKLRKVGYRLHIVFREGRVIGKKSTIVLSFHHFEKILVIKRSEQTTSVKYCDDIIISLFAMELLQNQSTGFDPLLGPDKNHFASDSIVPNCFSLSIRDNAD